MARFMIIAVFASVLMLAGQAYAQPVFAQDFDSLATGSSWLKGCKWVKHTRVEEGCGVGGGKCLRITHDAAKKEPSLFPLIPNPPPYGKDVGQCSPFYTNTATDVVQAVQPLPPAMEYSLQYDLYFEDGFDFARGGKLPGLTAKRWDSGCSLDGDPNDARPGPERWSVRLMWREAGNSELYSYTQDREPGACGTRSGTDYPFDYDKWVALTLYVKLNSTPTAKDGIARMYVNGKVARSEEGLQLRGVEGDDALINGIFFSTFFGGNEAKRLVMLKNDPEFRDNPINQISWAPKRPSVNRYDNVAVHAGLKVREAPGK